MTLTIDKMDGRGHSNTACCERLPKNEGDAVLATKGLQERRSSLLIKVSG